MIDNRSPVVVTRVVSLAGRGIARAIQYLCVVALLCSVFPLTASAQHRTTSAADLVQECEEHPAEYFVDHPTDAFNFASCLGFFDGMLKVSVFMQNKSLSERFGWSKPPFCAPAEVTPDQARKIFLKNMNDHPEALHENAASLAFLSLVRAFPCK